MTFTATDDTVYQATEMVKNAEPEAARGTPSPAG